MCQQLINHQLPMVIARYSLPHTCRFFTFSEFSTFISAQLTKQPPSDRKYISYYMICIIICLSLSLSLYICICYIRYVAEKRLGTMPVRRHLNIYRYIHSHRHICP